MAYVKVTDKDGKPIDSTNPLPVTTVGAGPSGAEEVLVVGSETLYADTKSVGTTAEALAASQTITKVVMQNDPDSTANVLVGNETVQSIKLVPGANITIAVNDLAKVFVKAESGTVTVNYLAGS